MTVNYLHSLFDVICCCCVGNKNNTINDSIDDSINDSIDNTTTTNTTNKTTNTNTHSTHNTNNTNNTHNNKISIDANLLLNQSYSNLISIFFKLLFIKNNKFLALFVFDGKPDLIKLQIIKNRNHKNYFTNSSEKDLYLLPEVIKEDFYKRDFINNYTFRISSNDNDDINSNTINTINNINYFNNNQIDRTDEIDDLNEEFTIVNHIINKNTITNDYSDKNEIYYQNIKQTLSLFNNKSNNNTLENNTITVDDTNDNNDITSNLNQKELSNIQNKSQINTIKDVKKDDHIDNYKSLQNNVIIVEDDNINETSYNKFNAELNIKIVQDTLINSNLDLTNTNNTSDLNYLLLLIHT